jgi:hypothetical protein
VAQICFFPFGSRGRDGSVSVWVFWDKGVGG